MNQKISQNLNKYDRFINYIHYSVPTQVEKVQIYSPTWETNFELSEEGPQMNVLGTEESVANIQYWVKKDFIVLVVPEKNGYLCAITEKPLFRDNTQCIVVGEESISEVEDKISFKIKDGLIVGLLMDNKIQMKTMKAANLPNVRYSSIYESFSQVVKQKITEKIVNFLSNPLRKVEGSINLQELCDHPTKNCGFLLIDMNKKDRTIAGYIKNAAFDYINSLDIYEIDFNSNKELVSAFGGEKDQKSDLVIYNPRKK